MELRSQRSAPRRYEPELTDAPYEKRYMPRLQKPLFRPPSAPYNPHLPAAAFPTLDKPRLIISELGTPVAHQAPSPSNDICQLETPERTEVVPSEVQFSASHAFNNMPVEKIQETIRIDQEPSLDLSRSTFLNQMLSAEPGLTEAYLMGIQCEMDTSDEDITTNMMASASSHNRSARKGCPPWGELSPVLRLEILHGLIEKDISVEDTLRHLGISLEEWQEMVSWDNIRARVADRENIKLQSMQEDIHRLLLDGGNGKSIRLTRPVYDCLFQRHLGSIVNSDKMNFITVTRRQLFKAHTFLESAGLSRSLAGLWSEPFSETQHQPSEQRTKSESPGTSRKIYGAKAPVTAVHGNLDRKSRKSSPAPQSQDREKSPVKRKYVGRKKKADWSMAQADPIPRTLEGPLANSIPNSKGDLLDLDIQNGNSGLLENKKSSSTSNDVHLGELITAKLVPSIGLEPQDNGSTILVQPKRVYQGTARPTKPAQSSQTKDLKQSATDRISQAWRDVPPNKASIDPKSFATLERLRVESMKHTSKKTSEPVKDEIATLQSAAPATENDQHSKNVKTLSVHIPPLSNTHLANSLGTPMMTRTASMKAARSTLSATRHHTGQTTPATSTFPLSGSGPSTRSPRATRLPANYRGDMMETLSPSTGVRNPKRRSSQNSIMSASAEKGESDSAVLPGAREPPAKKKTVKKAAVAGASQRLVH